MRQQRPLERLERRQQERESLTGKLSVGFGYITARITVLEAFKAGFSKPAARDWLGADR